MDTPVFYPDLKIVPIADIKLQEYVQKSRVRPLSEVIKKERVLRNPPIVTDFFDNKYLQLDGANRITAVGELGYPNCAVQIVDYSDPTHVHLLSWSHVIRVNKEELLAKIKAIPGVTVHETREFNHQELLRAEVVGVMVFTDKTIYEVIARSSLESFVGAANALVSLYKDQMVERVFSGSPWTVESIAERFRRYPESNLFVTFANYSPQQVMKVIDRGLLMPAGVTRHVVYRRKLNVNVPLEYLSIMPVEKANEKLQQFLQPRAVRLYEEPVIYFE